MTYADHIAQILDRQARANELLLTIAENGRHFFLYNADDGPRVSYFERDPRGRIWFHDSYSRARIYTHRNGPWKDFTQGGTLLLLVRNLQHYIRTGHQLHPGHFGPWKEWQCGGDLWGYGDSMEVVRAKARELNITREVDSTAPIE